VSHRYCGRTFCEADLALIRGLIEEDRTRNRAELSRLACRALRWHQANGRLKQMSCRVAMLRMQADGLIELPAPRHPKTTPRVAPTARTDPQSTLTDPAHALAPLRLRPVRQRADSGLWNEYVQRYHYLGYTPLAGAQLRYFVHAGPRAVALLGFGASAWQCAPRDRLIGWSHDQRQRNLHRVVNNARFLILPWVRSPNLASKILAMAARQLPEDWQSHYAYRPVLLETFVHKDRFPGTCYKAANWLHVGQTKGRGKLGPSGKRSVPIKDIWLYPLDRRFRQLLTQ
jgi:hypothetical protein